MVRVGVLGQFWVRVGWVVDVKGVPQVVCQVKTIDNLTFRAPVHATGLTTAPDDFDWSSRPIHYIDATHRAHGKPKIVQIEPNLTQ